MIIDKYKITYFENGVISQYKNLISQEEYKSVVKPLIDEISDLEILQNTYNKKNKKYSEVGLKIKKLKSSLSKYGEYFTDESPLGKALLVDVCNMTDTWSSGFMYLPSSQGGMYFVKFEKIK